MPTHKSKSTSLDNNISRQPFSKLLRANCFGGFGICVCFSWQSIRSGLFSFKPGTSSARVLNLNNAMVSEHLWSSGYDFSLTRWRSPVQCWPSHWSVSLRLPHGAKLGEMSANFWWIFYFWRVGKVPLGPVGSSKLTQNRNRHCPPVLGVIGKFCHCWGPLGVLAGMPMEQTWMRNLRSEHT